PRAGNNPFRHGKPPRPQGGGQGQGQGQGGYGQGGGGYGQENNGNRQPRLTSHGQPPVTSHTQPQLTMHTHGFGNPRPQGPRFGNQQNRNNRGGTAQPPKQRWEGLPKDEDEPK
ncbi:MAG TPA: hypothetical protein VIL19_11105, partial [Casimicrobiaceae bacterium]